MTTPPNAGKGCAVCNPELQRDCEEVIAERREEFSARLHIAPMGDGYHILEVPGAKGEPFQPWQGPFATKAAASLYRDDLVEAWAAGSPADAYCSYGIYEHFNLAGRLLNIIERYGSDNRKLANMFASERPWETRTPSETDDEDIAF
jgi:hypothetical protein